MRIPLFHLNAFTNRPFSGNPAAVCPLQKWLDDGLLRKVAAENNLSETAFFVPKNDRTDHYDLRWFTPRCEVKLCGHATLASAYVVLNLLATGLQVVRFETRLSGALTVRKDGEIVPVDCRPSDAIAVAVTARVPIYVAESVLEEACNE